ncbi:platelet endothelial aggregation receptor 1-like, partial [Empidonax traillii]|uniref:platelet endothelial aggregation receptor 1-like n=1 Tax=Empidonax traillii TaxID=164674 RepID=UPI000FFD3DB5
MLLRAAVLAVHAAFLAALRPSDPNVCSYWESFTAAVKESYTKPHVVSSSEPCPGGLGSSLPCPQHRVVYRTEYRQAIRTDYRRRYQCCLGYYESRDSCVPRCSQECVHGRCVAPELCQCEPGWRGTDCSSECDEQSWGPGCGKRCNCHHGAPCDPLTGVCSCPPGFADPLCHQPCPPGTYGQGCHLPCPCHHQAPSPACAPGSWGDACAQPCLCHHGGTCHPAEGTCHCPAGWRGTLCEEACAPGTFGLQCDQLCHCPHNATCHPATGTCPCPPGTTGPHCEAGTPEQPYTIVPAPPAAYSSLGVVLSLVALAALLVAVVVVALCYRHRQKGKESRHLAVAYTAGQTDTSDYMVPDVPPSHHAHYYSNPSYHTLSQCPPLPPGPQDRASSLKVHGPQLFPGLERPYGPEGNATLPPDWKHLGASAPGPRGGQLDRSYSYSYSPGFGKCDSKGTEGEGG